MRVWNLLCLAAMAVSVAAAGQPSAKDMIARLEKGKNDDDNLRRIIDALADGTSTPEDVVKAVEKVTKDEEEAHEKPQPTEAYPKDYQEEICAMYIKNVDSGIEVVDAIMANDHEFTEKLRKVLHDRLNETLRRVDWFAKDVAPTALPDCNSEVRTISEMYKRSTKWAIKAGWGSE